MSASLLVLQVSRSACPFGRHKSPRGPPPFLTYPHSPHKLPSARRIEELLLDLSWPLASAAEIGSHSDVILYSAQHTKAFHLPLTHSTCYDHPGDVLRSLRVILHVTKSMSCMFDDANSIAQREVVVSDANITLSIVVGR
jgi:hypothetical protein